MSKRRVVVTGLGLVSPVRNTVEAAWQAILQGQSGIGLIEHFDTSAYSTHFAGLVKNFNAGDYFPEKDAKKWICLSSTVLLQVLWHCRTRGWLLLTKMLIVRV